MATCNTQDLLAAASCFANTPSNVLQIIQTSILCQMLRQINPMASCDIQSLTDSARCFQCLNPPQLMVIQTQLLCELLQAGGFGQNGCLVCGNTDPVDPPRAGCHCSLAYNRVTSALFYWDETALQWFALIA